MKFGSIKFLLSIDNSTSKRGRTDHTHKKNFETDTREACSPFFLQDVMEKISQKTVNRFFR